MNVIGHTVIRSMGAVFKASYEFDPVEPPKNAGIKVNNGGAVEILSEGLSPDVDYSFIYSTLIAKNELPWATLYISIE